MKLKDLKISTQLQAGIGVILLLVALLGATAWFRANSMWQETKGLYEHPFAVRLALGEIKANALTIHRDMRSLILADNEQELREIKKDIDTCEARIPPQFQILYERYLGPRKDIDEARDAFAQWTSIRDETLRLLQNGNAAEAKKRVKPGGVGNEHAQALLAKLDTMSEFAAARATRFYEQASRHRDDSIHQLWLTLGIIFLLLTGIGVLLYRRIRDPLKEIGAAVEQFRQGKLDARSSYTSANEFGALSDAFNEMAANF